VDSTAASNASASSPRRGRARAWLLPWNTTGVKLPQRGPGKAAPPALLDREVEEGIRVFRAEDPQLARVEPMAVAGEAGQLGFGPDLEQAVAAARLQPRDPQKPITG